ncbi:MAG: PAS domain S-box protein [Chitinophagaceae bacterium]|nr:PAS domain S-box protein [Chitinophagaceae bacterium]
MQTILGYTREEALQMNINDFVFPEDHENFPFSTSLVPADKNLLLNTRYRKKDGTKLYCELNATRLPDGNFMGVIRDITERRKSEFEKLSQLLRYKMLLQTSQDGIYIIDINGKLLEWNTAFENQLGYTEDEMCELYVWDWDIKWSKKELLDLIPKIPDEGISFESVHMRKDGSLRNIDVNLHKFVDNNNKVQYYASGRDITEAKLSKENLIHSEEKLRLILENTFDSICVHLNGIWEMCNPAALKLFGYHSPDQLIGKSILKVIAPSEQLRIKEYSVKRMQGMEVPNLYQTIGIKSDGTKFDLEVSLSRFEFDKKQFVLVVLRDISESKKHEQELFQLNTELRSLSWHLQNIRETEKNKLALMIHDELGQGLIYLKLQATQLRNGPGSQEEPNKKLLDDLIEAINTQISAFKNIYYSVNPTMLEELGLHGTIQAMVEKAQRENSITIDLFSNVENLDFDYPLGLCVYRIIQESLTNIIANSGAKICSVSLIKSRSFLTVEITDKGSGFEIEKVDTNTHHGIISMRERVKALKGTFKITSELKKGTHLTIILPCKNVSQPGPCLIS